MIAVCRPESQLGRDPVILAAARTDLVLTDIHAESDRHPVVTDRQSARLPLRFKANVSRGGLSNRCAEAIELVFGSQVGASGSLPWPPPGE